MIALDLVAKRFGDAPVLGPITLRLGPGERVALTGPSGVGKSTLLRILAGLDRDFDGVLAPAARVAVVFQEPTLLPWRDVRANVTLPTGASDAAAERLLAEVGLGGRGGDWPGRLSLGQQRRLSLARALAAEPELLLMDEPFVSLEPALVDEMVDLVRRALDVRGAAAVIVTHAEHEARRLGGRILRLAGRPARLAA